MNVSRIRVWLLAVVLPLAAFVVAVVAAVPSTYYDM